MTLSSRVGGGCLSWLWYPVLVLATWARSVFLLGSEAFGSSMDRGFPGLVMVIPVPAVVSGLVSGFWSPPGGAVLR
jgi:hypothetical protein